MTRARIGDRYRSLEDVAVTGIVGFSGAPVSQSCAGTLPAGTVVRILNDPGERAIAVYARPVQYKKFEKLLVSADDRAEQHYAGYQLVLSFSDLASSWELLPPVT